MDTDLREKPKTFWGLHTFNERLAKRIKGAFGDGAFVQYTRVVTEEEAEEWLQGPGFA